MKLSCLPVSFFPDIIAGRMSVAEWAKMGAEIGFDGIDLSLLFVPGRSLKVARQMRRDVEGAGMRVVMLTTYPDFTHPDPMQRARELAEEQEAVMVAAELGAELVRVTAGQAHPETRREEGIEWATEGLMRLVESTQELGVTLVYENHGKPGSWQYPDFSQPPDIFLEIMRRTAPSGLGINFDTANATAFSNDPLGLLERVIPRLVSVHAAETAALGRLEMVVLGTGLVPFPALFGRIKKSGFNGWICIEEGSRSGRQGVEAAARFVRETWSKA